MDVTITLPGADRVEADFGAFRVATDQDGSAPSPFDLFLASIGTCAGIYVARFCRQRKIATEGLRIRQRMHDDPASGLVDRIRLEIELPDGFPAEYVDAVIRAAQLCRVKKHLAHPPEVEIGVVGTLDRSHANRSSAASRA
jgi:ribosomal protein S12 methylthiotransferase accessory factor